MGEAGERVGVVLGGALAAAEAVLRMRVDVDGGAEEVGGGAKGLIVRGDDKEAFDVVEIQVVVEFLWVVFAGGDVADGLKGAGDSHGVSLARQEWRGRLVTGMENFHGAPVVSPCMSIPCATYLRTRTAIMGRSPPRACRRCLGARVGVVRSMGKRPLPLTLSRCSRLSDPALSANEMVDAYAKWVLPDIACDGLVRTMKSPSSFFVVIITSSMLYMAPS